MDDKYSRRARSTMEPGRRRWLVFLLLVLPIFGLADAQGGKASVLSQAHGEVSRSFASAARHWNVPLPVVMAVGYVESRWDQRDGAPSADFGYGIMHVVDRSDGTMDRAAQLTGLAPDAIRHFAEANIEAGV